MRSISSPELVVNKRREFCGEDGGGWKTSNSGGGDGDGGGSGGGDGGLVGSWSSHGRVRS